MNSKKMFVLILTVILLVSGCSEKTDVSLISNKGEYTPLFFKSEEYNTGDYLLLDDVVESNGFLYEFGWETQSEDDENCAVVQTDNKCELLINTIIQYDEIIDAKIAGEKLYVIYTYNGLYYLSWIDVNSGLTNKTIALDYFPQSLSCSDSSVFVLSDDINSREVLLYRYDFNLEAMPLVNLSNMTDKEGFAGSCFRMCCNKGKIFLFGTNKNSVLYLYCLNEDMTIQYSKEIDDMPGRASEIFCEKEHIVLCSYSEEDSVLFINYIDPDDGTVSDRYEISDVYRIYSGYTDSVKLCVNDYEYYYYDIKEGKRDLAEKPECVSKGKYFYQSGDSYIVFSDTLTQIHTVCTKHDSNGVETEKVDLGTSVIDYGVYDGLIYALSYFDEYSFELNLYNDGEKTRSAKIANDSKRTCSSIILENEMLLMAMNETDNSSCLEKYDLKSGSQECIFSDGKSYITNLFKSENGVFFSADDDEGNIKIMEVTDNDVYALDAFEEVKISNVFCGDDQYDFYFESGSTIFGYNSKEDSGTRIIDLVDSGLIYRIDSFSKISEDCYFCLMTTDYDNIYLKLQKATDAENARFNNRKKIIIAGVNIKENTPLTEAVLQFNNENMDYYISVRDYSVKDKLLGSLEYDVIKSEVPDIYVFDQNFDVRALSNKNALCNLKEFMENDSDLNIDDLIGPVLNSTSDNDGVYGILTSFKLVGVVKENTDGEAFECESYSDFLKSLVDEKIYFKHAKETALWDYLVLSRANEFIDYKNNKCNFDADIFSNILKFIPDAINLEGTAGIHDINDFISLSCLSALYESNYDIIDVSCDLGNSFGFAVSSASDNKEVSWIFIKKFLTEDYQNQVQDFPVLRTSFQNKYTEAVKLNGRSASIYTPDASEPVSFTINVSDKEMKAILELIESVPYINSVDPRVKDILKEGIYSYTEKELTAEEVAKSIQNKVNLYLNEIAG